MAESLKKNDRWAAIGPYYAMFPVKFAEDSIEKYSNQGDGVLDPFCGRGTSVYCAARQGRFATGIEINEIGWIYSSVKLNPAPLRSVLNRISELYVLSQDIEREEEMHEFFDLAYCPDVLNFLLAARSHLKWKTRKTDTTVMAIILHYLHGKLGEGLSNQFRQTKCFSPDYSVKWWKDNNFSPPLINPMDFLKKRIEWRYQKGRPKFIHSEALFGDSTKLLKRITKKKDFKKYKLLLTSPPYCGVTSYYYDQWLRFWLVGHEPYPTTRNDTQRGKYGDKKKYRELLTKVFSKSANLMCDEAKILVRTDARKFTFETTVEVLANCFPNKKLKIIERPLQKPSQTALFGNKSKKPGEMDLLLN